MPGTRCICIPLFLLFLFPSVCLLAQDWKSLYSTALQSYESGDLSSANIAANNALEAYLKESGTLSENYAAILRLLQNIAYADGNFEKGLEYVNKELAVRENKKDEGYAGTLSQKGAFLQSLGTYAEADSSFREALEILGQYYRPTDFSVVELKANIGVNAFLKGDYDAAGKLFDEILNIPIEEISPVLIQARFFSGILKLENGRPADALADFTKAEAFYVGQGLADANEFASLLLQQGLCHHALGHFQDAEAVYKKAHEIFQTNGSADGDYHHLLNARAVNLQAMGKANDAASLLTTAAMGATGPRQALLLSNKAAILSAGGDYRNSEITYRDAIARLDRSKKDEVGILADILQNLAVLIDNQSRPVEADKILAETEALLHDIKDQHQDAWISLKINQGNIASKTVRYAEAMTYFTEALSLLENARASDHSKKARALSGIGLVYYKQGDIRKADSLFASLLNKYQTGEFPYDNSLPTVLNNFAAVKQTKGEFLLARRYLKDAADFTRQKSGAFNLGYARALENLGHIDLDIGSLTMAKNEIDSALFIYEKMMGDHSSAYASALINKGRYHQHAGEYSLAEPCFRRAFQLANETGSSPDEWIRAANALAIYYQTMGNYEQAEPLFSQMRARIEKTNGKNSAEYSTTLQNLATLHQLKDELDIAGPLLEEALAIDKNIFGDNHPQYIIALRNLAAVYQKSGKTENAKILLELALDATRNTFGESHAAYASTLSNLASLYQDLGNMQSAEKAWSGSVAIRKKLLGEQHPDYARSLYGLATVFFGQGKLNEANAIYKEVIPQYLRQIREYFPSLSEKEKGAFYQKIKPVFESYQDFAIQFHTKNPADKDILNDLYQTQLATKAILLNTSNKVRQNILSSGDSSLVNKFRRWLSVKEQIVHYFSLSSEERKQFTDIAFLRQKANDLEKQLSATSALFKDQFAEKEHTPATISSLLNQGESAVEILRIKRKFVRDSVYYAGLILKNGSHAPELVIWPFGQKLENRYYRFHRNAIKYHFRDTISYNYYWKPLAGRLGDTRKIFLSADGIFNKINFNILQNNEDHHWVLEDYTIHLLSNTKEIAEHATRKPSSNRLVNLYGFADFQLAMSDAAGGQKQMSPLNRNFGFESEIPVLPGTEVEVDKIGVLFKARSFDVTAYKGQAASELNLKKTPHVKILHIATHGFFMNDVEVTDAEGEGHEDFFNNPLLRSGILLAGAGVKKSEADLGGEDGILTAYEAMNIDLNETDLVVLSACETALGELKNGEGVYGLQRAFIVAGAEAVMMSLWQVDDVATQELMVDFYQRWLGGEQKHEAFRKAQLFIRDKYASPYYWGAFILVGE